MELDFTIDAIDGNARTASAEIRGRRFSTPAFMPVATRGAVKCLEMSEVTSLGYELILMNSYHLHQRPGEDVVQSIGGMHGFTGYKGAILTDSGGYQLFSFGRGAKIEEYGATVYSPYDGSSEFLTPEKVVDIQLKLNSDILMPLDVCLPSDAGFDAVALALKQTDRWLRKSAATWREVPSVDKGALFGIIQGGIHSRLRDESLGLAISHNLPGYALGGLSVGESREVFEHIVREFAPRMPSDKPRYLMGVGTPEDILMSIDAGVDMFDCVLPTRNARNGMAFTSKGRLNLLNAEYKASAGALDPGCKCPACTNYPVAYIAHLVRLKEITGLKLLTAHNLTFYRNLVRDARDAIIRGRWREHYEENFGRLAAFEQERREGRNADD